MIDGNNTIVNKASPEHRVEEWTFAPNTMIVVDIVMSTGEGKAKCLDEKMTTIYKRCVDQQYASSNCGGREYLSLLC